MVVMEKENQALLSDLEYEKTELDEKLDALSAESEQYKGQVVKGQAAQYEESISTYEAGRATLEADV